MRLRKLLRAARRRSGSIIVTTTPYTLQASDVGRMVQINVNGDAEVIVPTGLGSSATVMLQSMTRYPVKITPASGVNILDDQTSNSGSPWPLSNAYGRARNLIQRPGRNVYLTATSTNNFNLSGAIAQWQSITDRTGYSDAWNSAASLRQAFTRSLHTAYGASDEDDIVAVQFVHVGVWGPNETAIGNNITIHNSIEYPLGVAPTVRAKFGGSEDGILMPSTRLRSDTLILPTPIPKGAQFACRTWQSCTTGSLLVGKGMSVPNVDGEVFRYGTSTGTSEDYTLLATVPASTGLTSTQGYRPLAIIGITRNGAKIMIGTSKEQPSNGDYPTMGAASNNRRAGLAERLYGGNCSTLNLACSADSMVNFNGSTGALRRAMFEFGGDVVINGYGPNDLAAGSLASFKGRFTNFRALPEMTNRSNHMFTPGPYNVNSTDYFVTEAGQTPGNSSWETLRQTVLTDMRAGTFTQATSIKDVAALEESSTTPGAWKTKAGARVVNDGAITSGTNSFSSATANFTAGDTGDKIVIAGAGAAGAILFARMTYVSPTTVTLTHTISGAVLNAGTSVTSASAYIKARYLTDDGIHETPEAGKMIQDAIGIVV